MGGKEKYLLGVGLEGELRTLGRNSVSAPELQKRAGAICMFWRFCKLLPALL